MFQAGYLTIGKISRSTGTSKLRGLKMPNTEVR
jgi:hypothetical protein